MFGNLKKKTKKYQLEIKVKNKFFSSCLSFVFVFYTLLSPNLQIVLEKNSYTHIDIKRVEFN